MFSHEFSAGGSNTYAGVDSMAMVHHNRGDDSLAVIGHLGQENRVLLVSRQPETPGGRGRFRSPMPSVLILLHTTTSSNSSNSVS